MKPEIKEARKAIAACRERGDGVLGPRGPWPRRCRAQELLPEIIKLPPLKTLNFGLAGEVDSQSIDLTRREEKPKSNALQTFPAELIEAQSQLIFLNLRHNQLTALPEAIGGLAKLQASSSTTTSSRPCPKPSAPPRSRPCPTWRLALISLDNNQLAALPEAIGGLAAAANTLAPQQPARGPARVHRRPRPAARALARQQPARGPARGHRRPRQLQTLWLDNNQLAALPEAIGGLAQLQTL